MNKFPKTLSKSLLKLCPKVSKLLKSEESESLRRTMWSHQQVPLMTCSSKTPVLQRTSTSWMKVRRRVLKTPQLQDGRGGKKLGVLRPTNFTPSAQRPQARGTINNPRPQANCICSQPTLSTRTTRDFQTTSRAQVTPHDAFASLQVSSFSADYCGRPQRSTIGLGSIMSYM